MSSAYFDTSALLKLVVDESESGALRAASQSWTKHVSSELAVVELLRSVRRRQEDSLIPLEPVALQLLQDLYLVPIRREILYRAAHLDPPVLRSLDAIHLASALDITAQLDYFVAYDVRLLEAARTAGFTVLSPS